MQFEDGDVDIVIQFDYTLVKYNFFQKNVIILSRTIHTEYYNLRLHHIMLEPDTKFSIRRSLWLSPSLLQID